MQNGAPAAVLEFPLIEKIGSGCHISDRISVWRRESYDASNPLIELGDKVVLHDDVRLVIASRDEYAGTGIHVGDKVIVNAGSFLSGEGGLVIEEEVLVGPQVKILSGGHDLSGTGSIYENSLTYRPIHIGRGAWIGAGATILQGCVIGHGAVIAAGAIVTSNVPPLAIVMGAPARIHGYRTEEKKAEVPAERPIMPAVRVFEEDSNHRLAAEVEMLESKISGFKDNWDVMEQRLATTERALVDAKAKSNAEVLVLEAELATTSARLNQMRHSLSWKLTMPFRFVMRVIRHGLLTDDRDRLLKLARRVYNKIPLPGFIRQGMRRGLALYRGSGRVTPLRTEILGFGVDLRATVKPAAQLEGLPDYFFWGVIDWHFRTQRPQHLAENISASRRVFYISVLFADKSQPGFQIEQLDTAGRLFQVKLHIKGAPSVYASAPCETVTARLRASLGELLLWTESRQIVSVLQHPYWCNVAASLPNSTFVYDCMDHHEGFGNNGEDILALEYKAMERADLTVVTSDWLDKMAANHTSSRITIRNAGDYEHFATRPAKVYRDRQKRRIIGYYGAIADWFDTDLVAATAAAFPECLILLVGADTTAAQEKLSAYSNISFTGEVPYTDLPFYLYAFDVCLLPFRICPITIATNPVKLYEYLSAGASVVAVDVPEMNQFTGLIRVAADAPGFIAAIREAVNGTRRCSCHRRP